MPSKLRGPLPAFVAVLAFAGGAAPAAAAQPDAREVARAYLAENAQKFGVTAADFSDLMFTSVYETKGLGVTHVNINQRYRDMEVFGGQITVNVGADGKVVFAGGQAVSLATVASDTQNLDARAMPWPRPRSGLDCRRRRRCACCAAPGSSRRRPSSRAAGSPARRSRPRSAGSPTADGLRLAWRAIIDESDDAHLWNAAVDAKTGALLKKDDWTSHDNLDELKGRLQRSKARQLAPAFQPAFLVSSPEPVLDGSAYRVTAWPNESPLDAARTLVSNPADSIASPVRLARHQRRGRRGLRHDAGQQRPRLPRPGRQQRAGLRLEPERRLPAALRLPDGHHPARAGLSRGRGGEPLLRQQHDPRRPLPLRLRRRLGQLPGRQLRPRRRRGRLRPRRGAGRQRHQQRQLLHARPPTVARRACRCTCGRATSSRASRTSSPSVRRRYGASWARFGPPVPRAGLSGKTLIYGDTGCNETDYPVSRPDANWIAVVDGGTTACTYLRRVEIAQSLNADAVVVAHNAAGATPPVLSGLVIDEPTVDPGRGRQPGRRHRDQGAAGGRPRADRDAEDRRPAPRHPRR